MKRLKYVILSVLLVGALLFAVASCDTVLNGQQTAEAFLECLRERNFSGAYAHVRTDMSLEDFTDAYENFFDVFEVTDIRCTANRVYEQNIYAEYSCTLTYESASYDPVTDDFSFEMYKNTSDRFVIEWTPALILPELSGGDYVLKTDIGAKRGDIIADHTVLAETVPQKAVSINVAVSDTHTKEDIDEAAKIVADTLSLTEEEVVSKLQYHIFFRTRPDSSKKVDKKDIAADIKRASQILGIPESVISNAISSAKADGDDPASVTVEIAQVMAYDMTDEMKADLLDLEHIQIRSSIYFGIALVKEYHATRIDEEILRILENVDKRYGITISDSSVSTSRYYPHSSTLAHVIGYMGSMSADNAAETVEMLNEGRTETDGLYTEYSRVGTTGLEYRYEKELRGYDGYRVYICAKDGGNKRTLAEKKPQNGLDVQLTIDYELQRKAEELIKNTVYEGVTGGVVIVMNPNTGAVEAMASYPDYDLNLFSTGITQEEYEKLSEVSGTFTNKAIQGRFIPGSVIKAVTASAALSYHVVEKEDVFDGEIINDTWRIPEKYGSTASTDRIKRDRVKRRNEPLNMKNAFIHSDNIYFADIMLKMGDDRYESYWNSLGLDTPIDFELPVSSSQYKQKDGERTIITVAETGFGQGTMLVTPLQLACTYCAFANGGSIPVPYIVEGLYRDDEDGYTAVERTSPRIWRENAIKDYVCDDITEMLEAVTDPHLNGTASRLGMRTCKVAGKTGTAQTTKGRNNSWFVGYRTGVSSKNARLVLVLLEVPADSQYSTLKLQIARPLLELD